VSSKHPFHWTLPALLTSLIASTAILPAACSTRPAPAPAPAPPATATPPAPAPAVGTTPAPAAGPAEGPLTLPERLAREAATRPSGGISADLVASALSDAGVPLGALKQVLARPVGARYCALARTAAGLVVSVCEFEDDAGAARGVDLSRRTFDRLIPGRRLIHRHGTLLTLTVGTPDARRAAEAARAEKAFAAL
jgi:hypothetical protein